MSTTRHHINRQRRRQARETRPAASAAPAASAGRPERTRAGEREPSRTGTRGATAVLEPVKEAADAASTPGDGTEEPRARSRRRPPALALLCVLTVLLGGFAGWAHAKAEGLRSEPARSNTALTDLARTSEIKGQVAKAVDRLFSYDHADPGALDAAAKSLLTGKAVDQHRELLADVRARADEQKAVITTTVTESAVERIDGDRARVLVYADQSSVATAGKGAAKDKDAAQDDGVYAAAMLAVDVVHRDGRWRISALDTFGR
ncbi:Mce-associated membrane protein OS=Streptomyces tendae OX=1932 GN=GUR47_10400 PE=4 SV=1 [Streptomyces tendae]